MPNQAAVDLTTIIGACFPGVTRQSALLVALHRVPTQHHEREVWSEPSARYLTGKITADVLV